jgi:Mg2+ and Co2+ transporter CorA
MKKSELKEYIKEQIIKTLSEVTIVDKKTKPNEAPEIAKREDKDVETVTQAIRTAQQTSKPVTIAEKDEDEEIKDDYYKVEDEDGDKDKGPTKSELKNIAKTTKGIAKAKDELARLTQEMKSLAKKYQKAEGAEKEKMLADLRKKTDLKKELEAIVFPKEK